MFCFALANLLFSLRCLLGGCEAQNGSSGKYGWSLATRLAVGKRFSAVHFSIGLNVNFSGLNFLKKFRFASFLKKKIVLIWTTPIHQKLLFQVLQKKQKLFIWRFGFPKKKSIKLLILVVALGKKKVTP